jgi:hypothetical protein
MGELAGLKAEQAPDKFNAGLLDASRSPSIEFAACACGLGIGLSFQKGSSG